jgi:DNA-binding protein H-NS
MESKSTLRAVSPSPAFKPRNGQISFLKKFIQAKYPLIVTGQFPTGYGKTIVMAMIFRELVSKEKADRMLIVVASDQQAEQMARDFAGECKTAGLRGVDCWRITNSPADSQRSHLGKSNVFVTTIGMLASSYRGGGTIFREILRIGKWFVACDEYHHYVDEANWGEMLKLACFATDSKGKPGAYQGAVSVCALSATPWNRGGKTIFSEANGGQVFHKVSYKEASDEGSVKKLQLRAARFEVTFVAKETGEVFSCNTCNIRDEDIMAKIATMKGVTTTRGAREKIVNDSPKYCAQIFQLAMGSLINKRAKTGLRLQMLVRTESVLIAKAVASVIERVAGSDLRVDWVGEGKDGRSPEDNKRVLAEFIPGKDGSGNLLPHKLDVLVQVGKCSEGSNTVMVSDLIDLSFSKYHGKSQKDIQWIGRVERIIPGCKKQVKGTLWVPTDSELLDVLAAQMGKTRDEVSEIIVGYRDKINSSLHERDPLSKAFIKWFGSDGEDSADDDDDDDDGDEDIFPPPDDIDWDPVWEDDDWGVEDVEISAVYSPHEEEELEMLTQAMSKREGRAEPDQEFRAAVEVEYRRIREGFYKKESEQAKLERLKTKLNSAAQKLARAILDKFYRKPGVSYPSSMQGDLMKKVNSRLMKSDAVGQPRDIVCDPVAIEKGIRWIDKVGAELKDMSNPPSWASI